MKLSKVQECEAALRKWGKETMSWNYRVYKESDNNGDTIYSIRETFYEEDNTTIRLIGEPYLTYEHVDELRAALAAMLHDTYRHDIVIDFPFPDPPDAPRKGGE